MKRNKNMFVLFLLVSTLLLSNFAIAYQPLAENHLIKAEDRITFSKNILIALHSDNTGLKVSAMQKVVKYRDLLDINSTALELIRVYRTSADEKMRKLALITIHAIQNDWALGIIKRDLEYEKSPNIKNLMISVLKNETEKFKESDDITAFLQ